MYKALLVVAVLLSPATSTFAQSLPDQAIPDFNTGSSTHSQADITNPGGFGSAGNPPPLDRSTTGSVSNDTKCRPAHATHKGFEQPEKKCR